MTSFVGTLLFHQSSNITVKPYHFVSSFAKSGIINEREVSKRLNIRLLKQEIAVRYCDLLTGLHISDKRVLEKNQFRRYKSVVLHCYDAAREPSHGMSRMVGKMRVFKQFSCWIINEDIIRHERQLFYPNDNIYSNNNKKKRKKTVIKSKINKTKGKSPQIFCSDSYSMSLAMKVNSILNRDTDFIEHFFNTTKLLHILDKSKLIIMNCAFINEYCKCE